MKYIPILVVFPLLSFVLSTTDDLELNKKYKIIKLTSGNAIDFPKKGDNVVVHYTGTFPSSGSMFDSSRDRNDPFKFKLGLGQVIKGWDEVVSHMSVGETIYFICPSQYAYGNNGVGTAIAPNTDIEFVVELLKINKSNIFIDL